MRRWIPITTVGDDRNGEGIRVENEVRRLGDVELT
jgi:hypothetical protein